MTSRILVDGRFGVDDRHNPPPVRPIEWAPDGTGRVRLGPGVSLALRDLGDPFHSLLDQRVRIEREAFRGLGSVEDGCGIYCVSNSCANWAVRSGRPRLVGKVIAVLADEPRYVLLTVPRYRGAARARNESKANRLDAGLVPWVLHEPAAIECARCVGPNRGVVRLES